MFIPSYLLKSRHGVFYIRWPLPKQLHPLQKATTIKLSLETRDPRKALRLSRSLIQIGEQLVEDGIAYGMRYDEIRAALTRHFKDLLEKKKRDIAATGRLSSSDREKFIARQHEVQKAIDTNTPIPTNKTESELLDTFIRKYQLNILPDSEQYRWLQRDIKPAFRSLITSVLAYDDSLDHFDLGQSIPITSVSSPAPRPSPKKTTVTLHDLSDRFIAERSLGNNWVPRTKLEKRDHIDLLKEIIGSSRDITSLTPQDVTQVKDTLTSLPKNRHKNKVTRDKPLAEVLKISEALYCVQGRDKLRRYCTSSQAVETGVEHALPRHRRPEGTLQRCH